MLRSKFCWILLTSIVVLIKGSAGVATKCSPEVRTTNLTDCLDAVTSTLYNPDLFWFGNSYKTRCPAGSAQIDPIRCTNPKPDGTSIGTRLFSSLDHITSIDRFLELRYESGGKDYTACGNRFTSTETWTYDVDPLSDTIVYPWYVKNFPIAVDWSYQPGDLFTLIVYDIGYYITHGVFINIQGDDMTSAQVIRHYSGPLITTNYHNPYVFLLYKQTGVIQMSQEWKDRFTANSASFTQSWTFEQLKTDLKLQGLVGVNFIVATGDEYAAGMMESRKFLSMCPVYATRALRQHNRPFVPQDVSLTVWIDVNFTNEELEFSVCCKNYKYPESNFMLNPLGDPVYTTADVRTSNPHTYSLKKLGMYATSTMFTGTTHTLIIFDPDVPNSGVGTESRPLLHGIITNIKDGNFSTGDVGLAYQGPRPPNSSPHTYYFFLYEQNGTLNANDMMTQYDGDGCNIVGRCLFDINRAVSENNLMLVGATWLKAQRDAYVIQRYVESGAVESEECVSEPNYPNICDTSGAAIMTSSVFVIFLIVFLEALSV